MASPISVRINWVPQDQLLIKLSLRVPQKMYRVQCGEYASWSTCELFPSCEGIPDLVAAPKELLQQEFHSFHLNSCFLAYQHRTLCKNQWQNFCTKWVIIYHSAKNTSKQNLVEENVWKMTQTGSQVPQSDKGPLWSPPPLPTRNICIATPAPHRHCLF